MRYSLKQLAVFDAVADSGSVSQAAQKLSLTQSATSMSLAQLEKILCRPLFERKGKRLLLTHWGCWLRPKAKRLLHDAKQIETGFYDQHLLSGEIRIGVSQTPAEHLIPNLISNIDTDFPQIRISLCVERTNTVISKLLDHRYELGIIEGRCDDHRLNQLHWCTDHLIIVGSAHHPFSRLKQVSMAQLEQAKWVLREPGSGTRTAFESAIYTHVSKLDVWREYEYVQVIRHMVANGLYLSCLPYLDVVEDIEKGTLVALNVPEIDISRSLSFVWRADMPENPLVDCIKREGLRMLKRRPLVM